MKKINHFLLLLVVLIVSCNKQDLQNLDLIKSEPRVISASDIVASQILKDNESVTVPFHITLSGPATKAFQVAVGLNADTVTQLIANGTLKNTVLASIGSVFLPSVVNVAYGADSASGTATIKLSELEFNYGKNVAFVIRLSDPGKGNTLNASKSNILAVINTAEIMKASDIHYLYISNGGGGMLNVEYQKNYAALNGAVNIPLILSLANQASGPFNVTVSLNIDTITKLINKGALPANTIQLKRERFYLDTMIRVGSNLQSAQINLNIPWSVFDSNIVANSYFAFAVTISNPTRHVLDPKKSTVIVLVNPSVNLDNNGFIKGTGTGLKAQYYTNNKELDFDGRAATYTTIDATIDFNGKWTPSSISNDNSSAKWTGEFLAPVRGMYTFYQTRWDDGCRLKIDGVAIIDDFTDQWEKPTRRADIFLNRGQRYKIEVHHRQGGGGQEAHLEYEVPLGNLIAKQIVPQSQFFPAP